MVEIRRHGTDQAPNSVACSTARGLIAKEEVSRRAEKESRSVPYASDRCRLPTTLSGPASGHSTRQRSPRPHGRKPNHKSSTRMSYSEVLLYRPWNDTVALVQQARSCSATPSLISSRPEPKRPASLARCDPMTIRLFCEKVNMTAIVHQVG